VLCKSLSGVEVPLLTITSRVKSDPMQYNLIKLSEFDDDPSKLSVPMYKRKKYVIIGARVHPGESNSSFMMQGFVKYLLGDSHSARQLRKRVVFKVVPMINPDGVIIGNYRTSMSGNDLNRRYHKPDFRIHPTVCAIKQIVNELTFGMDEDDERKGKVPYTQNEDVLAFIDMHGHSRKKNVFIYGPQVPLHSTHYFKMRIIPKLLSEET
jgi:murein tripeptide amidase MpaA